MTTPDIARARRTVGAVAMAAAVVAWWPAFTVGAWGGVFFEQILTLWAAAAAAFAALAGLFIFDLAFDLRQFFGQQYLRRIIKIRAGHVQ